MKIAILTSSNKRCNNNEYGRCISGVTKTGEWIRLVADKFGDSIRKDIAMLIPLGSVIEITFERAPLTNQIENVILKSFVVTQDTRTQYVQSVRRVNELGILGNTENRLSSSEMRNIVGTLRLIDVEGLVTYRLPEENCKTKFVYQGHEYIKMSMTAPDYYAATGNERKIGNAYIVVSISEKPPHNKFVAAIYPHK